jgi:hypothetical protein
VSGCSHPLACGPPGGSDTRGDTPSWVTNALRAAVDAHRVARLPTVCARSPCYVWGAIVVMHFMSYFCSTTFYKRCCYATECEAAMASEHDWDHVMLGMSRFGQKPPISYALILGCWSQPPVGL